MPLKDFIDNPRSERIRRIALLSRAKRNDMDRFMIEGPQSVREAIRYAADTLNDLYVLADVLNGSDNNRYDYLTSSRADTLRTLVDEALSAGCYVHPVSAEVLAKLSGDSQGILAVADARQLDQIMLSCFERLTEQASKDKALRIAACWQVRDPGNAGAIVRVADVAGCDAVIFLDECVHRFNPKVVRSTAGSLFHVPVINLAYADWLRWSRAASIRVVAADIYGTPDKKPVLFPQLLEDTQLLNQSVAIMFGNEARGLPQEVLANVDDISLIPIYGKAESMNLATSAAVMLMGLAMSSHKRTM